MTQLGRQGQRVTQLGGRGQCVTHLGGRGQRVTQLGRRGQRVTQLGGRSQRARLFSEATDADAGKGGRWGWDVEWGVEVVQGRVERLP